MKQLGPKLKFLKNFKNLILDDFKNKPIEKIASYNSIDLQLAWALVVQDKGDMDKILTIFPKDQEMSIVVKNENGDDEIKV